MNLIKMPPTRSLRASAVAIGLLLVAAGCGTNADEVSAIEADANERVLALEAQVGDRDEDLARLGTDLETRTSELAVATKSVVDLESAVTAARADAAEAESRADSAEAEVERLLITYDQEIRAAADVAWDAELARACAAAGEGTAPISTYTRFTNELAIVGDSSELTSAVEACAEPLRARSEDEKLNADCEAGSVDAIEKNPESFTGSCLTMFVLPFQWDSRTGECNFLGGWDPSNLGTRSYEYDGDGLFRADTVECAEDLDGADQDDLLKVWVEVIGVYRYDTAAGGTNEIPEFRIRKAELVQKS